MLSIDTEDGRVYNISENPSVKSIDEWLLLGLGCQKTTVGKTFQGRDISLYWMEYFPPPPASTSSTRRGTTPPSKSKSKSSSPTTNNVNVLFLSLVHGNEPMGLMSLLMAAKELSAASSSSTVVLPKDRSTGRNNNNKSLTHNHVNHQRVPTRIYFLPVVNVDAYTLNLGQGGHNHGDDDDGGGESVPVVVNVPPGCKRSNFRDTCDSGTFVPPCPHVGWGGVDLNRNFPVDWTLDNECSTNYGGPPHPLSEPETQAIAHVVEQYNITHAMSLHSRLDSTRPSLLIHPYASTRPLKFMKRHDRKKFRTWSKLMNKNDAKQPPYVTGTAKEAIHYTAGGTTIDWMYTEKKITAFVLEASPPCNNRWCTGKGVFQNAERHSWTMKKFVSLAMSEEDIVAQVPTSQSQLRVSSSPLQPQFMILSSIMPFMVFISLGFLFYIVKKHQCRRLLLCPAERLLLRKKKQDLSMIQDEKVEMLTPLSIA